MVSLFDQCGRPKAAADRICGSTVLATLADRRRLQHRQTPVGAGVFLDWLAQWGANPSLGDVDRVLRAGGSDRCGGGSVAAAVPGGVDRDGLSWVVSFHASLSSGRGGRPSCLPGRKSGRARDPETQTEKAGFTSRVSLLDNPRRSLTFDQ